MQLRGCAGSRTTRAPELTPCVCQRVAYPAVHFGGAPARWRALHRARQLLRGWRPLERVALRLGRPWRRWRPQKHTAKPSHRLVAFGLEGRRAGWETWGPTSASRVAQSSARSGPTELGWRRTSMPPAPCDAEIRPQIAQIAARVSSQSALTSRSTAKLRALHPLSRSGPRTPILFQPSCEGASHTQLRLGGAPPRRPDLPAPLWCRSRRRRAETPGGPQSLGAGNIWSRSRGSNVLEAQHPSKLAHTHTIGPFRATNGWSTFAPNLGAIGPNSADFHKCRPNLAPNRPGFGQDRAISTRRRQIWEKFGQEFPLPSRTLTNQRDAENSAKISKSEPQTNTRCGSGRGWGVGCARLGGLRQWGGEESRRVGRQQQGVSKSGLVMPTPLLTVLLTTHPVARRWTIRD